MKKSLFLSFIFLFFVFFFRVEITNYSMQKACSFFIYRWGGSLEYSHFQKTQKGWLFKNLTVKKENHNQIHIETLEIIPKIDLQNFKLLIHLNIDSPKALFLYKKLNLSKGNSKIQISYNIQHGCITHESQTYYFDCLQEPFSQEKKINVYLHDTCDSPNLVVLYNSANPIHLAECKFYKFDLDRLKNFQKLFVKKNFFEKLNGLVSGLLTVQFDRKLQHLFYHLSFEHLSCKYAQSFPLLHIEKLQVEGEYPKIPFQQIEDASFNFIKKMGMYLTITNAAIESDNSTSFQNLSGTVSYNPGVGPKWDIKGVGIDEHSLFSVQTTGKGYFHSAFSNWLNVLVELPEVNSSIIINLEEQKDKTVSYNCQITDFNSLHLQHLMRVFYKKTLRGSFEQGTINATCSGKWELNKPWQYNVEGLSGHLLIQDGKFHYADPQCRFDNLQVNMQLLLGEFRSSKVVFESNQTRALIAIAGTVRDPTFQTQMNGTFKDILSFYPPLECFSGNSSLCFQTQFTLKQEEFFGTFTFMDNGKKPLDSFRFSFILRDFLDQKKPFIQKIHHGWVKAEQVQLQRYFDTYLSLKGVASISATFEDQKANILFAGQNIEGTIDGITFKISEIGYESFDNSCAYLNYSFKDHLFLCEIPLKKEVCYLSKYDLTFENTQGRLVFDNDLLKLYVESTECNEIDFSGLVYFQKKNHSLQIQANHAEGSIESLTQFLSNLSINIPFLKNFSGKFKSQKEGFYLTTVLNDPNFPVQYKGQGKIYDVNGPVSLSGSLQKLEGSFSINSFDQTISISEVRGKFFIQSARTQQVFDVYIPFLQKQEHLYQYDIRISKSFWDIFRFVGSAHENNLFYTLHFDKEKTQFFGTKLNISHLIFKDFLNVISLKMNPEIYLSSFTKKITMISDLFFPKLSLNACFDHELLGKVCCEVNYEQNHNSTIKVSGKDLQINQQEIKQLLINAQSENDLWNISNIIIGPVHANCNLSYQNSQVFIENFTADFPQVGFLKMNCTIQDNFQLNGEIQELQVEGSVLNKIFREKFDINGKIQGVGRFSIDPPYKNEKWQIESDLDLRTSKLISNDFALENKGSVQMYFSLQEGLVVRGLDLHVFHPKKEFTWMRCKIGRLYHKAKDEKYFYSDLQVYLPKNGLDHLSENKKWAKSLQKLKHWVDFENDLDFSADGSFDIKLLKLNLKTNECHLNIKGERYFFKDLNVDLQPNKVQGEYRLKYQSQFIPMGFVIDFGQIITGNIYFQEEVSPLTIHWFYNHGFQLESINGSFQGLNVCFHKETTEIDSPFIGTVKLNLKKAKNLFPPLISEFFTELDMQQGYELSGRFYIDPFSFEGVFRGKDCVFAGCVFRTLLSSIQINKNSIQIKDFKISDRSGIFKMDQVHIEKNETNKWMFSIPKVDIKEFRPSLLRKIDQNIGDIKPLVIRKLVIQDLHGDLEKKNTYVGRGFLTFVNSFKREHTLLDVPADFFGRIFGLDMELLIPVTGSLEFDIHDQKLFVHDLKDSYSEGKRSKFFLVDKKDPHTIDFDGNLNVYIQMKHFVLFKFTEPFILSIEGSLQDPKVSLKTKKRFFSSK